jgi:predicted transcriptional regulator
VTGKPIYFDPEATGPAVFLGPLEAEVMEVVWRLEEATVKQVLFHLKTPRRPAYTTVMTTMSRLASKGVLERTRRGRSFVYRPTRSRQDFIRERVRTVRDCLKRNFGKK